MIHELGHAFHYSLWQKLESPFPVDQGYTDVTVNELIADLFAHVFLETDGCHRKKIAGSEPHVPECNRRLNEVESNHGSLFNELLAGLVGHSGADSVRRLAWLIYREIGRDEFARRFVESVDAAGPNLVAQKAAFTDRKWWSDPFLNLYRSVKYPHSVIASMLMSWCAAPTPKACSAMEETVGTFDEDLFKDLLHNSPTHALEQKRTWAIHEFGETFTAELGEHEFQPGKKELTLWISSPSDRVPFRKEGPLVLDPVNGYLTFTAKDGRALIYTVGGDIRTGK
jgi:hypothetical protein